MEIAQKLYELGHITYMRTDQTTMSEEAVEQAKKVVESKDVMAVTRTATTQDALIAFVQIMSKRFFTSRPELYVEMNVAPNNNNADTRLSDSPNAEFANSPMGVTRRALTSNEYPVMFAGDVGMLKNPEKWEIVIVRPNIEHNMLAAVLGRGGMDELGATFWGQTELSCYVGLSFSLSRVSLSLSLVSLTRHMYTIG